MRFTVVAIEVIYSQTLAARGFLIVLKLSSQIDEHFYQTDLVLKFETNWFEHAYERKELFNKILPLI